MKNIILSSNSNASIYVAYLFSVVVFWLLLSSYSYSQRIHSIPVPSTTGVSFQQTIDEFWQYHSLSTDTWHSWRDNTYIQQNYGFTWPNQMAVWDDEGTGGHLDPCTRFTGNALIGYVRAWRCETNTARKSTYYSQINKIAEYLLCLQSQNSDGSFRTNPANRSLTVGEIHATTHASIGLAEAYITFWDSRYLTAALAGVDWQMNVYPTYPYGSVGLNGNCPVMTDAQGNLLYYSPCTFYSNVNHMGLQLWHLSYAYLLTGDQKYLDRCIAIAEEIIAWQDYRDDRDPWPVGSLPDGGWYWHDYSPDPIPQGSPSPPPDQAGIGFNPNRYMGYHAFTIKGLLKLLEVTGQQSLPGITTFRNRESFRIFKTRLCDAIIKAT